VNSPFHGPRPWTPAVGRFIDLVRWRSRRDAQLDFMAPENPARRELLRGLAATGRRFLTLSSESDQLVAPGSSLLPGRGRILPDVCGHNAVLVAPRSRQALVRAVLEWVFA